MATAGGSGPAGVTPPGLDGTELREATMGDVDVEVGTGGRGYGTPTNGQGASPSTSSPRNNVPNWGLAEAVQRMIDQSLSSNALVRDLTRQAALRDNYGDTRAQALWTEYVGDPWTLRIFASMKEGSSRIRLLWGCGKFHDIENTGEVPPDVLAFAGKPDAEGHSPAMVALPIQKSYKWAYVKGFFENMEDYEAYYANDDNKYSLRPLPAETDGNVVERKVPRLLHLPYELGLFAARTQGLTAFDLYQEAKRLANDSTCPVTLDDLKVVLDWCVAAAYETSGNSVLALKTRDATSDLQAFVEFKQKKCNLLLGQPPARGVQHQEQQQQGGDDRMLKMVERIMASTLPTLAQAMASQNQGQSGGGNPAASALGPSGSTQLFAADAERAAVMGWAGITDPAQIPKIWRTLKATNSILQRRLEVSKSMQEWSIRNHIPINKLVHLPEDFFKDVLGVNMSMDEACASYMSLDRGMSAQVCLRVTRDYILQETAKEEAEHASQNTRTYSEALARKTKTKPRTPPLTMDELKLAVATFAALLCVFLGDYCPLYQQVLALRKGMDMGQVEHKLHIYTPLKIMEYWFEVLTQSRAFFFVKMSDSDLVASTPMFPTSLLGLSIQAIHAGRGIENGDFPAEWRTLASPTSGGGVGPGAQRTGNVGGNNAGGNSNPRPPGQPPNFNGPPAQAQGSVEHCHPIIKREFAKYHEMFDGRVMLQQLCRKSGVEVTALPYINQHVEGDKNMLCYNHVLGVCPFRCIRKHLPGNQIPDGFATEICNTLKKGRDALVERGPVAPSSGSKRRRQG